MKRNQTTILLVEDDENLGLVTKMGLEDAGFNVDLRKDGFTGLAAAESKKYEICILDVMLPRQDGFSLAKDIKKLYPSIPIIFLTAKSLKEDKITGLKLGADDYITKPFDLDEVVLRIEAILNRVNSFVMPTQKDAFQIGLFEFDYHNQTLKLHDQVTNLTKKEADLLRILATNMNNLVERETALTMIWGSDDYFLGRSMDVFITRLRKYLKGDEKLSIVNVHGVGYKLTDQ